MDPDYLAIPLLPAMSDRPSFGYPPINMVYAPQWNDVGQQPTPSAAYYPHSYTTPQGSNHSRSLSGTYGSTKPLSPVSMDQNAPYASYPPTSNRTVPITAQQSSMYTHPAQQSQPLRQPHIQSPHTVQTYPPTAPHPLMAPPHSPPQYNPPMLYAQSTDVSQYPASPNRPFSCDMCALSFNRQHDLKRHRETHSGEKPFLCNGGCGKTFTRKDALKRHQLVKQCGHDDES